MASEPLVEDLVLVRMRLSRVRRQLGGYHGYFLLYDEEHDRDLEACIWVLDEYLDGEGYGGR